MADNNKGDPRRKKYVETRAKGVSRRESAIAAGFSPQNAKGLERTEAIQAELAEIRRQLANKANITKEDVAAGMVRAAELAEMLADPQGMIAAWRELARLFGFNEPEVKKIEKGISRKDLKEAIDSLSDDDLRKLAQGRVIDGEFQRVPHEGAEDVPQLPES